MLPIELDLPFLGQRTYLHGTTLFDAMTRFVPDGPLSFKIRKRIDSPRVRLQESATAGEGSASLQWRRDSKPAALVAIELPAPGQARRERYDEAYVERQAHVKDRVATLLETPPYGLVQALIPLFKALLRRKIGMTTAGQWMFTRLDLSARPARFIPLELTLAGIVPNALARAKVACGGAELGMLYFSWVAKD